MPMGREYKIVDLFLHSHFFTNSNYKFDGPRTLENGDRKAKKRFLGLGGTILPHRKLEWIQSCVENHQLCHTDVSKRSAYKCPKYKSLVPND
jgi:hypothetical protein